MCTASQASLLGHLGLVCTLPCRHCWRAGVTGQKLGATDTIWHRHSLRAVVVVVGGTVFGHEPQLIHCTRLTNPSFMAVKNLGTANHCRCRLCCDVCPPTGTACLPQARHVREGMVPCGFLPAPLFATGAREGDWTVRPVYSAHAAGVKAAPLFLFLLFTLTLFNILCPALHFFSSPTCCVVLSKEYYYTCREWGGHKSRREEGLMPTLPPRELLFQTKRSGSLLRARILRKREPIHIL